MPIGSLPTYPQPFGCLFLSSARLNMPNDLQRLSSEKSLFSRKKDERPFSILGREDGMSGAEVEKFVSRRAHSRDCRLLRKPCAQHLSRVAAPRTLSRAIVGCRVSAKRG